ncbi:MAG: hypothetical protein IBJ18_07465 [Phycisphaerales bacterium]|nr:hypothetical protein [Phycisphaerales bacterium]
MDFLVHLWLPIMISGVAVFVLSALGWMAVNHHAKDQRSLPDSKPLMDALEAMKAEPGVYMFPMACGHGSKEQKAAAMAEMFKKPTGVIRIWKMPSMGGNMLSSLAVYLVISVLIAYLGWSAFGATNKSFAELFKVLGTAGVLAYSFAFIPNDIWFQNSRRATVLCVIDGVIYGLATGAIFAAMWPKV